MLGHVVIIVDDTFLLNASFHPRDIGLTRRVMLWDFSLASVRKEHLCMRHVKFLAAQLRVHRFEQLFEMKRTKDARVEQLLDR